MINIVSKVKTSDRRLEEDVNIKEEINL